MESDIRTIIQPDDYEGEVKVTLISVPAFEKSSSAVLYIHGYLDYYFQNHMGKYFAEQGYNFYAIELRKYGRSLMNHQHFNYCRKMEEYFPDIDAVIDIIIAENNVDITLIGHSTGGLLSSIYCANGGRKEFINRLILNSPFLEFNVSTFFRDIMIPAASTISIIFPYANSKNVISENYFKSTHLSQYGEWDFDTQLKPEIPPPLYFTWLRAISLAHKKVRKGLSIPIPILVMFSSRSSLKKKWSQEALITDTILNVKDIMKYSVMLGNNVTLEEVMDGLHDLVLSAPIVREKVLTEMLYFIEKRS